MRTLILATLAVLAAVSLRTLPPDGVVIAVASVGLLLLRWPGSRPWGVALCAAMWLLWVGGQRLGSGLQSGDALVTQCRGQVQGLPVVGRDRVRFLLRVAHCGAPEEVVPAGMLVRVNWYRTQATVLPGERWRLTLKLRPPSGRSNPHGFDFDTWLFTRGIGALGTVRDGESAVRVAAGAVSLDRLRWQLRERLRAASVGLDHAGLVEALVVGSRDRLDPAHRALLSETGAAHLVAISGLHIGMVAGIGYVLAHALWWFGIRCGPARAAVVERHIGAVVTGCVFASGYAALAGFSLPTLRALIMLAVFAVCQIFRLKIHAWHALAVAAGVIFVFWPLSVLDAGFWMSFLAVLAITVGLRGRRHWSGWQKTLWINIALGLVLTPVTVVVFGMVTWLSPLANVLLVPLFGVLLVPCVLLAAATLFISPAASRWLLSAADTVFGWLLSALARVADALPIGLPSVIGDAALAALAITSLLVLLPRSWRGAPLCGVAALVLAFSLSPERPARGSARFTVLDVGHGLAVVVETRSRTLVYDAGPRYGSFDTGKRVVAPVVIAGGRSQVDMLVVSHADSDHAGGVAGLLRTVPVERVVRPENGSCAPSLSWSWDGVAFSIEHPTAEDSGSENDRSCVLRVRVAGGQSALLLGDVEARGEAALVRRGVAPATLISVPHHGSKSSSSAALLDRLSPQLAINSHARGGRFRLPHPAVVQTYAARGVPLLGTADNGAVRISLPITGEVEAAVERWRWVRRRFWHRDSRGH